MRASSYFIEENKYEELQEFLKNNERRIPPPELPETVWFGGLFRSNVEEENPAVRLTFARLCSEGKKDCQEPGAVVKENIYPPWLFLLNRMAGNKLVWYKLPIVDIQQAAKVPTNALEIVLSDRPTSTWTLDLEKDLSPDWAISIMVLNPEFTQMEELNKKLFEEAQEICEKHLEDSELNIERPIWICPRWLYPVLTVQNRTVLPKEAAIAVLAVDHLKRGNVLDELLEAASRDRTPIKASQ